MSVYLKAAKMVTVENKVASKYEYKYKTCCNALVESYGDPHASTVYFSQGKLKSLYKCRSNYNWLFLWGVPNKENSLPRSIALLLMHEMQKTGDL